MKKLKKLTSTGVSARSIYESMVLVLGDIAPLLFASFVILIAGWFKVFGFRSSNENDRLSRGSRTVRRSRHGPRTPVPGQSRRRRAPGPNPHNNGTRRRRPPRNRNRNRRRRQDQESPDMTSRSFQQKHKRKEFILKNIRYGLSSDLFTDISLQDNAHATANKEKDDFQDDMNFNSNSKSNNLTNDGACKTKKIHKARRGVPVHDIEKNETNEKLSSSAPESLAYTHQISCSICFEEYQEGEQIAFSNNEGKCRHAYHVDCILEWLMDHDDCPTCREQYFCVLMPKEESNSESDDNREQGA